ncbi:MAG: hypothetical protein IJX18_03530, partial [Clostridia bacterium]|nr:hypothetical protein [Clostridia bacterium]
EMEKNSPILPKKEEASEELPNGVIPFSSLPKAAPLYVPETIEGSRRRRKDASALREKFPDLFFEKNVVRVEDEQKFVTVETDYFGDNQRMLRAMDAKMKQEKLNIDTCRYVGKVFNTYIFYEKDDEVYIIDQHAAHERLIFDKLREEMRFRKVRQQPMITPFILELNAFESEFIREHISYIREMGFEIEEFGDTSFKVSAVPMDLQKIDLGRFFNGILGEVAGYRAIRLPDLLRDKLAGEACKAAVKGGMDLSMGEMDELLFKLDGNMGLKCPHGRPIVAKLTKTQIENMFKRIV